MFFIDLVFHLVKRFPVPRGHSQYKYNYKFTTLKLMNICSHSAEGDIKSVSSRFNFLQF